MNYTALSLSQAPPLSVPLRFFLTAPLFIIAAALLIGFGGTDFLVSRWTPSMLALTHLVTLGFLGSVMIGALQQLLPVLVGVPVIAERWIGLLLYLLWTLGTLSLVSGMGLGWAAGLQAGAVLLGLAVLVLAVTAGRSLVKSASRHATVTAMAVALVALLATISVPLYLLLDYGWQLPLAHPFTRFHIGWGAVGWIGMLVIGVAYQVVPMFQITPEYPRWLRRGLVPMLAVLLLLWPFVSWPPLSDVIAVMCALALVLFALQTLRLQRQRRRKLADVTLDFWRLAMVSLILAPLVWLTNHYWPLADLELLVGLLFLIGFVSSAVNGMIYKIVPFLIWLHLNNQLQLSGRRQGKVPNMKQVIPERMARWQFRLHLAVLILMVLGIITVRLPPAVIGMAWLASSGLLWWNLMQALRLYRRVAMHQGE